MASKYSKKLPAGKNSQQIADTEIPQSDQNSAVISTGEKTVIQNDESTVNQDEPQSEQQPSPSWFERLKVWLSGLFRKNTAENPGIPSADIPDVDDETSLLISEYETVIDRNRNIIEAIRQQPNAATDGMTNIARNLYQLPVIQQYIKQLPPPPAVEVPENVGEPENGQDGNSSVNRKITILWIVIVLMILVTGSAVWQCQSFKNQWQASGFEKGVQSSKPVVDSLQAIIVYWQQKWQEDGNRASWYAIQLKSLRRASNRAEIAEFFRHYDEYLNKDDKVKRLEKLNDQLKRDNKDLKRDFGRLLKTAYTYARQYDSISAELAVLKQRTDISERKSKSVFNTIEDKKVNSQFPSIHR